MKLGHAVQAALKQVIGAYAIVVLDKMIPIPLWQPEKAADGNGIGADDFYCFRCIAHCWIHKNVVYLEDEQIGSNPKRAGIKIRNLRIKRLRPYVQKLTIELESIERAVTIILCSRKFMSNPARYWIACGAGWKPTRARCKWAESLTMRRIWKSQAHYFVACGTSWRTGLVGEYLFEELARVPVEVEYAIRVPLSEPHHLSGRYCYCHFSKWWNRRYTGGHRARQIKGNYGARCL